MLDSFDIRGLWNITLYYPAFSMEFSGAVEFSGSTTAGTSAWNVADWTTSYGTYSVSDMDVTFNVTWESNQNVTTCVGTASDDNNMSGTLSESGGATGTWTATR